jgi:glycosyltransferase involved in cell wall biosynthesis
MRIVRYYPRAVLGDGGMTAALRHWSEAVAALGEHVVIAFDGGTPPRDSQVEWVDVRHVGPAWLRLPVGLQPVLRGADVMVMQSAWAAHNLRAGAAARNAGVPYVLEPRGAYDPHIVRRRRLLKRVWWRAAERRLVRDALAVHVFFESERAHLEALGCVVPRIVAPNGVVPPTTEHWDGGTGEYLLWVGRFDPEHKGLDLLVKAVAALPPGERPNLRLHGPDRRGGKHQLAELVARLGVEPWVQIGPPVHGPDKDRLMAAAGGFVYPSRWEAFGNAPAEAAALGVPVLATPYPLGRFLAEHDAAIVAEPSPQALADGLLALRGPHAEEIGRNAARVVQQAFRWEDVARSWLEQARTLLLAKPAGPL